MAFNGNPAHIYPIRTQHIRRDTTLVSELDTDRAYSRTLAGLEYNSFYLIAPHNFRTDQITNDCDFQATLHFIEVNWILTVKADSKIVIQANQSRPNPFERCIQANLNLEDSEAQDDPIIFYYKEVDIHAISQLEIDNHTGRNALVLLCKLNETCSHPPRIRLSIE